MPPKTEEAKPVQDDKMKEEEEDKDDKKKGKGKGKGKGNKWKNWNISPEELLWGLWNGYYDWWDLPYYGGGGKSKGKGRKPLSPEEEAERKTKQAELRDKLIQGIKAGIRRSGGQLRLAQVGSIPEVAKLRDEYAKEMKDMSLSGFIKNQNEIFSMKPSEKTPNASAANFITLVNPDDGADLPDAEIPTFLSTGVSIVDRWQNMRKLIIGAVQRRGGSCGLENIGQEAAIQEARKGLQGGAKLQDFVKKFPMNFELRPNGDKPPLIAILSEDTSSAPVGGWPTEGTYSGRGKGGGRGGDARGGPGMGRGGGMDRGGMGGGMGRPGMDRPGGMGNRGIGGNQGPGNRDFQNRPNTMSMQNRGIGNQSGGKPQMGSAPRGGMGGGMGGQMMNAPQQQQQPRQQPQAAAIDRNAFQQQQQQQQQYHQQEANSRFQQQQQQQQQQEKQPDPQSAFSSAAYQQSYQQAYQRMMDQHAMAQRGIGGPGGLQGYAIAPGTAFVSDPRYAADPRFSNQPGFNSNPNDQFRY